MKKYIFLFIFGLLMFVLTFLVALHFFDETNENFVSEELEKTRLFRELSDGNKIEETVSQEEKISLNTELIIYKKYNCGHVIESVNYVDKDMINLTKEQFEKKYPEYIIKDFSRDKIIVEEENDGMCGEHFIISIGEDFVEVFRLNQDEEEELYMVTNICRDYLAQSDIDKLLKGIEVYGRENINSKLEDYE